MAELNDTLDRNSAFHPDNIAAVQFISIARIYDLLAVMALNQAGDDNDKLNRVLTVLHDHEQGIIRMASPAFRENE